MSLKSESRATTSRKESRFYFPVLGRPLSLARVSGAFSGAVSRENFREARLPSSFGSGPRATPPLASQPAGVTAAVTADRPAIIPWSKTLGPGGPEPHAVVP